MADYGLVCYDELGREIFTPYDNAGILLHMGTYGSNNPNAHTTIITVPGLDQGVPVLGWYLTIIQFPRTFSYSISGTTVTLNLGASDPQSFTGLSISGVHLNIGIC